MPQLRQMNANLMRAPGLQPAREQRVLRQLFFDLDVGDGFLAQPAHERTSPPAIAAITDQMSSNSLRGQIARYDGQVAAHDRVLFELPAQALLGPDTPGEDAQPARFLFHPLNHPKATPVPLAPPAFRAGAPLGA